MYKIPGYWSREILSFDFLEKVLGLVSPSHFVYDFSKEIFLMLYFINPPNFIVWLSKLLEMFGNIFIVIIPFPDYDLINFEI